MLVPHVLVALPLVTVLLAAAGQVQTSTDPYLPHAGVEDSEGQGDAGRVNQKAPIRRKKKGPHQPIMVAEEPVQVPAEGGTQQQQQPSDAKLEAPAGGPANSMTTAEAVQSVDRKDTLEKFEKNLVIAAEYKDKGNAAFGRGDKMEAMRQWHHVSERVCTQRQAFMILMHTF